MTAPIIALLTDFGTVDPFVGIVKAVIAGIAPETKIIDITHEIPPGDIQRAAVILWQAAPFFPPFTIFLAIVDPGVGTERRPILLQSGFGRSDRTYFFIGPDNGLFTYVQYHGFKAWELANPSYRLTLPSMTFHGRDIFAPAAAYAARGIPGSAFGPMIADPVRLPAPWLHQDAQGILSGEILFADHFGNYLTSLGKFERQGRDTLRFDPWLPGAAPRVFSTKEISIILPGGLRIRLAETFGAIPDGSVAILVGSSGLLEIAANRSSAFKILNLPERTIITLENNIKPSTDL
jgi:S-adenosyl-L-methionine hydrolase (adenosine-forming)